MSWKVKRATGPPSQRGQIGGGCQGPRDCSMTSATARTSSSSNGRPITCTPMGRPSFKTPTGTEAPGKPVKFSHCEKRMVSRYPVPENNFLDRGEKRDRWKPGRAKPACPASGEECRRGEYHARRRLS